MKNQNSFFSRRDFLLTSSLGLAALALPGCAAAKGGSHTDKMKLGLVTYLWGKDWDVPTLIANCEKSGIMGVELRTEHAHGVDPPLSTQGRADVRKRFADSRVELVGLGTNQDYHHVDPAKLRESIERTKEFVRLSHDVGGSGVKVKPNAFPKEVSKEKTIEQIGKSLREVGQYAADFGQQIRVEVHGNETQELPNMKAIMDVADHKNVTVCWNSNEQDLLPPGLEYNFNLVKKRFGDTVHVRELNIGDYPYQQLMNLFVAMNYQGWILLECRTQPQDLVQALIEQRQVWEKMIQTARQQKG